MTDIYTFVGEDSSMGYRTGHMYALKIEEQTWQKRLFRGWRKHWALAIEAPTFCPYESWESFNENWSPVHDI